MTSALARRGCLRGGPVGAGATGSVATVGSSAKAVGCGRGGRGPPRELGFGAEGGCLFNTGGWMQGGSVVFLLAPQLRHGLMSSRAAGGRWVHCARGRGRAG